MFAGDIRQPLNKKAVDDIFELMEKTNVSAERKSSILGGINNARTKFSELIDILDETSGKVIIWASFVHDITAIRDALAKEYGEEAGVTYYGETPQEERQQIVKNFQEDETTRFFIGQPRTGGFGLTLTAASTVIYYSNSYDLEIRLQSEDRAHRIGQKNNVTYIDLIAEDTVDEKIVKALRDKINIASEVMGEKLKEWI